MRDNIAIGIMGFGMIVGLLVALGLWLGLPLYAVWDTGEWWYLFLYLVSWIPALIVVYITKGWIEFIETVL